MSDERIQYLIERYVEGRISDSEQTELDTLRSEHAEVDRLIAAELELRSFMATAPEPKFRPFFDQRVMRKIEAEHSPATSQGQTGVFDVDFSSALAKLFPRVATPAFAVSALAMASNASAAAPGATLVESLFALPTLDAALTLIV